MVELTLMAGAKEVIQTDEKRVIRTRVLRASAPAPGTRAAPPPRDPRGPSPPPMTAAERRPGGGLRPAGTRPVNFVVPSPPSVGSGRRGFKRPGDFEPGKAGGQAEGRPRPTRPRAPSAAPRLCLGRRAPHFPARSLGRGRRAEQRPLSRFLLRRRVLPGRAPFPDRALAAAAAPRGAPPEAPPGGGARAPPPRRTPEARPLAGGPRKASSSGRPPGAARAPPPRALSPRGPR
ncbi:proline-rich proteoglycan 2-like [Psammomys obesus]|uniref:proline-rich proteoglycan 2-like n=1 Tax=Psammomys obesus TaxID=48139 RepID=UPI002452B205|nr:proline-rich proteoglycan 2-like [Psammomys obesus]